MEHLNANSSGLVDELSQANVISKEDRDRITSEVSAFMLNAKLLSVLSHKTKDQFDKFLNALDKTGQQHLHNHIIGRKGQLLDDRVCFVCSTFYVCAQRLHRYIYVYVYKRLYYNYLYRLDVPICMYVHVLAAQCVCGNSVNTFGYNNYDFCQNSTCRSLLFSNDICERGILHSIVACMR